MAIRTDDRLGKYEAHENKIELVEKNGAIVMQHRWDE
jgi:hypothetical protein